MTTGYKTEKFVSIANKGSTY